MSDAQRCFFDTNIFVYLAAADVAKADRAEAILAQGGVVSVQVLNEFTSVVSRKQNLSLPEIRDFLATIRTLCEVVPLSVQTHERGLDLVERFKFSIYDAMIVAAAQLANCTVLYTEDLHHGQVVDGLAIRNPFRVT
ncbi:PIN domain-containing protein [Methylovirgula sp. HY1]|uniref:PIN domain-containing protein n=1 Tax=Methylovirgula sp. HY1 TaxID=2822761 RepID=UPI001C5B5AE0|nr:PIN domain-containing protein [Methylovirgula sp. HY1]QXX76187.1 tRNA(fMet)-specific endonuclease VapC [Methylovirgula sp. HY1]